MDKKRKKEFIKALLASKMQGEALLHKNSA
jgi:hypothetical protein